MNEAGRRTREGQRQAKIANELNPMVENVLDEFDRRSASQRQFGRDKPIEPGPVWLGHSKLRR
jgi:hypothetical protein